ncbi:hypothetical protein ACTMTU_34310 [Streptomyces sp. OZ13]|uniref:hypothetical protein n=1 Tax=Streptomyces sp. OZ13 TaxID=3452210 RepID=UPI003F8B849E
MPSIGASPWHGHRPRLLTGFNGSRPPSPAADHVEPDLPAGADTGPEQRLVFVNTLMLQAALAEDEWASLLTGAARRGMSPQRSGGPVVPAGQGTARVLVLHLTRDRHRTYPDPDQDRHRLAA